MRSAWTITKATTHAQNSSYCFSTATVFAQTHLNFTVIRILRVLFVTNQASDMKWTELPGALCSCDLLKMKIKLLTEILLSGVTGRL
jgi:hypothetical protein